MGWTMLICRLRLEAGRNESRDRGSFAFSALVGGLLALIAGGCSCDDGAPAQFSGDSGVGGHRVDGSAALMDGRVGPLLPISVPADSEACENENLPFRPTGCTCVPDTTSPCWTGPLGLRGLPGCRDGIQTCEGDVEFSYWSECVGEVQECMQTTTDDGSTKDGGLSTNTGEFDGSLTTNTGNTDAGNAPPPPDEDCQCVPGSVINCSEDCAELIICLPFSTKECLPDGTWGPCREALLPAELLDCRNLFHGCLLGNPAGVFLGDCSDEFTCGHPPGGVIPPSTGTPTQ